MTDFLEMNFRLKRLRMDMYNRCDVLDDIEFLIEKIIEGKYILINSEKLSKYLQDVKVVEMPYNILQFKTEFSLSSTQNVDENFYRNLSEKEREEFYQETKKRLKENFLGFLNSECGVKDIRREA